MKKIKIILSIFSILSLVFVSSLNIQAQVLDKVESNSIQI